MRYRCIMDANPRTRTGGGAAKERAYAYTKQRVLDLTFAGGSMLSEGEVAQALGLSRTPVREAFLQLESEGLLQLYPKRGALVVPVSTAEVMGVVEARLLVERFAVAKVIENGIAVAHELELSIAQQNMLVERDDGEGFVEADREFHRILLVATSNPLLLAFYDSLRDRQRRMIALSLSRDAHRARDVIAQHRELAVAISEGDLDTAYEVLERHLSRHVREAAGLPT
jgi:DNA-binding GntR family transcriptional regulator